MSFLASLEKAGPVSAEAFRPVPGVKPMPVHDAVGCRWPVQADGNPLTEAATHFCGSNRAGPKLSYCAVHQRLSAGLGTPSERSAVREARRVAA